MWDGLFLDPERIAELLKHVEDHANFPFIFPMFAFVAFTGARRSEMMRCQVEDIDFNTKEILIREKKRDKSVRLTFRKVSLHEHLATALDRWLTHDHPGGPHAFC